MRRCRSRQSNPHIGQRQCPAELRPATKATSSCRFPDQIVVRELKRMEPTTVSSPHTIFASSTHISGTTATALPSHRQPAHHIGLICDWDFATAIVPGRTFHPLLQQYDGPMIVLAD